MHTEISRGATPRHPAAAHTITLTQSWRKDHPEQRPTRRGQRPGPGPPRLGLAWAPLGSQPLGAARLPAACFQPVLLARAWGGAALAARSTVSTCAPEDPEARRESGPGSRWCAARRGVAVPGGALRRIAATHRPRAALGGPSPSLALPQRRVVEVSLESDPHRMQHQSLENTSRKLTI